MKIKPLTLAISSLLMSMSASTIANTSSPSSQLLMQQMQDQVQARINEVKALAADPTNIEIVDGKKRLKYGEYRYEIQPNGNPMFFPFIAGDEYADNSAAAMFDFVKAPWRLINEWDGVFIFHDQFGYTPLDDNKKCNIRYLAATHSNQLIFTENEDCLPIDKRTIDALGFIDELPVENHLVGNFAAQVRFIQNQTSEPTSNADKSQQKLVTHREALLVLTPEKDSLDEKTVVMRVYKEGMLVEKRVLTNPTQLMKTDRVGQDDRPDIQFSKRSYSSVLPWHWVEQGLSFTFMTYDGREGELSADSIEFGAPIHVDMPMIRIGMLTEPPASKPLETHVGNYGAELFQRFPFSTLTISQYLPVQLDKVVTARGEVEEEYSYYEHPDVYSGDLREEITKSLIQTGINNANYGITSTAGTQQWHPANYPSVVIGHSIGRYMNKDGAIENITHGLSGGNGMALLVDSIGNEVTHEIGHAFSLWHWPGGPDVYYHSTKSGWGYDAYRGRMTDNVVWYDNGSGERNFANIVGFGKDPMAGGDSDSRVNHYPLFTGYTSKVMQDYLTGYDFLDMDSPSGYVSWDAEQQTLSPVSTTTKLKPVLQGVDVMTMVGYYDPQNSNTSHIYPPMYGSSGQVYDLPSPKIGQCWASVTYIDGKEQKIALHGTRYDGTSNKFHINLARAAKPQSMSIHCPERALQDMVIEQLLENFNQDRFFDWGENDRQGTVGDIFSYHRNGRIELFRLERSSYWYFPDVGGSNKDWTFVGYIDAFVEEYVSEQKPGHDMLGQVKLATRTFTANNEYPARAVTFGKGQGYDIGVENSPTFDLVPELRNSDFASIDEFERRLLSLEVYQLFAGNYRINNGIHAKARFVGALYSQWNLDTDSRDYFLMKHVNAGALPRAQMSNEDWKYLGSAETYVNLELNPILLDREVNDHATRIKRYYGVDSLFSWDQRMMTLQPFAIFVDTLSDGNHAYFMQKVAGQGGEFPTSEESNTDWYFLATDSSLTAKLASWKDQQTFEQDVLDWYRQNEFGQWGSNGKYGTVGDIYDYNYGGKTHYYRLKTEWYSYFPHPSSSPGVDVSNHHWQYLGYF